MTTRSICWGLLGAGLAFGQAPPATPESGKKTLADRMGELSRKLKPGDQKALQNFTGTFSRKPRPIQRILIQPRPEVCAAPLLEGKPAGDPSQWTMRVAKPPEPLPRMPQLQPPAPACPSRDE
jgi:hypothetical protein